MPRTCAHLALLAFAAACSLAFGCSSDGATQQADTSSCSGAACVDVRLADVGGVANVVPPQVSACAPPPLVAHVEPIHTVGDGSLASCTEFEVQPQ